MNTSKKTKIAKPPVSVSDKNLRQFVGYSMKRAFLLVQEDMANTLKPLGLRMMTFSSLAIIVENPDISQKYLAQALGIDRSGVVVLVDELEKEGLISREKVEGDRRSYALRASLSGQKLWKKAQSKVQAHEQALFAGLSEAERDHMHAGLNRFVAYTAKDSEEANEK